MSRLRRLLLNHRVFFITTHFLPHALPLLQPEFQLILSAAERARSRRRFLLFAFVLMPTHVHLLLAPDDQDSLSDILREFKLSAAKQIRSRRQDKGAIWQARSFDRIVRDREEFAHTVDYIHWNPVRDGLVENPAGWQWSSWFGWNEGGNSPIPVDLPELPFDEHAPLKW